MARRPSSEYAFAAASTAASVLGETVDASDLREALRPRVSYAAALQAPSRAQHPPPPPAAAPTTVAPSLADPHADPLGRGRSGAPGRGTRVGVDGGAGAGASGGAGGGGGTSVTAQATATATAAATVATARARRRCLRVWCCSCWLATPRRCRAPPQRQSRRPPPPRRRPRLQPRRWRPTMATTWTMIFASLTMTTATPRVAAARAGARRQARPRLPLALTPWTRAPTSTSPGRSPASRRRRTRTCWRRCWRGGGRRGASR
mmetsp:Transcript_16037/g.56009  ORF Transcript_16037/g.56009 Transcript_16037/m.56009 type:complete len:261 (-) Transcript_16037:181-963(-)